MHGAPTSHACVCGKTAAADNAAAAHDVDDVMGNSFALTQHNICDEPGRPNIGHQAAHGA